MNGLSVVQWLMVAAAGISAAYWLVAAAAARYFFRMSFPPLNAPQLPPVSVLKPVKGMDHDAYDNFRSYCVQHYSEYEILFAVHDVNDPAIATIERLAREFPERSIRVLVVPAISSPNRKVESLRRLMEEARHERIVYSDADIRVPPDYLRRLAEVFSDPSVGLVTCPYRATAPSGLGGRLEALTINVDFLPAILVAWGIEGVTFALGATIATSKRLVRELGGFEALKDFLADDYQIGNRAHEAGFRVVLLPLVVDHVLPPMDFAAYWRHQLRWARTIRVCRPWGALSTLVTHAWLWGAAACAALGGGFAGWGILLVVYGIRAGAGWWIDFRYLTEGTSFRSALLLPLRDVLGLGLWAGSFLGNRVIWRGETFRLTRDGRMAPIRESS